jgi:hypothetical protein
MILGIGPEKRCVFRLALAANRKNNDVEWFYGVNSQHLKAGMIYKRHRGSSVEDMMVDGPLPKIVQAPVPELIQSASGFIESEIVQSQNFRNVRQIILALALFVIFDHMGKRRNRPAVIESAVPVGQQEKQQAVIF